MKVSICGLLAVANIQEKGTVNKVLSIIDFNPYSLFSSKVETENTLVFLKDHEKYVDKYSPNVESIAQILEFSSDLKNDDEIIIHCMGGISRSPAAAMVIAWDHLRDIEAVENFIMAVRPICAPNRLICHLADVWFNNSQHYLTELANKFCDASNYRKLLNNKHLIDGVRK